MGTIKSSQKLRATLSGKSLTPYTTLIEYRRVVSLMSPRSTVQGYARFSPANAKWTKHTVAEHVSLGGNGPLFVGTPAQVADSLETWVREADVDGFNFVSVPI